ncbi:subtilase family protein [Arabidopsis lyrata subsp. lyrata]|uniref:Subtilase family protein n=1 Tax=Arabidopsis lyrata subsp. lyrata TaxID=81972 RepID=D7MER3_ARALL|nr:subtilase family protein [Arabidopsis lyrata subsp. lyrata]
MDNSLQSAKLVLLLAIALVLFLNTELNFHIAAGALDSDSKVYIVYLGEREHDDPELVTASHHQMLESLLQSKEDARNSLIYSYQHGFSGFAALLTSSQAKKISEHPAVIHFIPNRILKLKTTRTWDHLGLSPIPTSFSSLSSVKGLLHDTNLGREAIIGVIDSGIWPESKALNDQWLGPIPKRWRGKCEPGEQFNATIHCNNKLIGAKYYLNGAVAAIGGKFNRTIIQDFKSTRDANGHGTHTATIAGGSFVPNVSIYGLARGLVRGGAPRARIASYKACWNVMGDEGGGTDGRCTTADMWKAFDDAIHDGVDVLSVSIGGAIPEDSEVDKLDYIAAFHAVAKGITVVTAAGNEGPGAQTVNNVAPWLLTVAATTLDRSFPTKITLGNKQTLFAESLFTGPEISTGLVFLDSDSDDNVDVKGKTVLVFDSATPIAGKGVAALILAQKPDDLLARCNGLGCIFADYELGTEILKYIRTTRSPTVRISAARTLTGQPATTKVAAFSCRGPNSVSPAILKPDIAAPGVSILAAISPLNPEQQNGFGLLSGTSMSTPVVSGIIALLKSLHPNWSPAAMRSALVTTEPIFAEGSNKKLADPFDYGGGLVNPEKAAKPGLVYDMGIDDYINYMCSAGYNDSSISRVLGKKTKCPIPEPSMLDINLPSITIPNLEKEVTLTRTVTNVGPIKSVYKAVIEPPLGITLTVNPTTLVFKSAAKRVLTFSVKAKTSHKVNSGYFFGSLTWTDGVHDVIIPVSVKTRYSM